MTQPAISHEQASMFERCIVAGGIAVFPTDTVYGLACGVDDAAAFERIYALKGRRPDKPSAVLFFQLDLALEALAQLGPRTQTAVATLLPGPATLILRVQQGSHPTHQFFGSVEVWWKRKVTAPPPDATFNDVPTGHPLFQFVEALANSGITAGCGSGNFCPDAPLTRGQMAVFLAKALGLHAGRSGPSS